MVNGIKCLPEWLIFTFFSINVAIHETIKFNVILGLNTVYSRQLVSWNNRWFDVVL